MKLYDINAADKVLTSYRNNGDVWEYYEGFDGEIHVFVCHRFRYHEDGTWSEESTIVKEVEPEKFTIRHYNRFPKIYKQTLRALYPEQFMFW